MVSGDMHAWECVRACVRVWVSVHINITYVDAAMCYLAYFSAQDKSIFAQRKTYTKT